MCTARRQRTRHEQRDQRRIVSDPAVQRRRERDVGELFAADPRTQTPVAEHRRADHRRLRVRVRHRRDRQHRRLRGDRPQQLHAHGHQLLPVQFGRLRSHTFTVR